MASFSASALRLAESASVYQQEGQLEIARRFYLEALQLNPDLWQASFNLGLTYYRDSAQIGQAIHWFRQTLQNYPQHLKARMLLAECLYWHGECEAAIATLLPTLPEDPRFEAWWAPEHQAHLRQRQMMTESWLLKCMYGLPHFKKSDLLQVLRRWAARWADPLTPINQCFKPRLPGEKLRMGFFSQEFGNYSSRFLIEPLLRYLDRTRFEIFAFSDAPPGAEMAVFRTLVDHWIPVYGLGHQQVLDQIRAHEIDILHDLGGHTHPERLLVFARRAAPVQMTGLGFGVPVSLKAMDGFLTDSLRYPPHFQPQLPEKLLYLDTCIHWQPPAVEIPLQVRTPTRPFTFGSANSPYKLHPELLACWAEILAQTPGSCLLIKCAPCASVYSQEYFRHHFMRFGIAPERVSFEGLTDHLSHLARFYHSIDLSLDAFPYNGGVTSCESLWMGVPFVSLNARNYCGASILKMLQMEEWLAVDRADYIRIAVEACAQPEQLQALKFSLRERLLRSPICQLDHYTRQVEQHSLALYQDWRNQAQH
jgi:protein O-GlcNAc transferase